MRLLKILSLFILYVGLLSGCMATLKVDRYSHTKFDHFDASEPSIAVSRFETQPEDYFSEHGRRADIKEKLFSSGAYHLDRQGVDLTIRHQNERERQNFSSVLWLLTLGIFPGFVDESHTYTILFSDAQQQTLAKGEFVSDQSIMLGWLAFIPMLFTDSIRTIREEDLKGVVETTKMLSAEVHAAKPKRQPKGMHTASLAD